MFKQGWAGIPKGWSVGRALTRLVGVGWSLTKVGWAPEKVGPGWLRTVGKRNRENVKLQSVKM